MEKYRFGLGGFQRVMSWKYLPFFLTGDGFM